MEISYGKILVYSLTFLAYAYTGIGANFLANLRDAVLSAENLFGNVMKNVIYVADRLKNLNEVFDAAIEEHCKFECRDGAIPKMNKSHVPTADGCGSLGLSIDVKHLPVGEMTKCCDAHDICYDTCNNDKEMCDIQFKRCLYRYCDTYKSTVGDSIVKACKGAAKMLFTGTLTLGCKSYLNAQEKACYCPSSYGWKKEYKNKKYSRGDEL